MMQASNVHEQRPNRPNLLNILGDIGGITFAANELSLPNVWQKDQLGPEEELLNLYALPAAKWGHLFDETQNCVICSEEYVIGLSSCPFCDFSLLSGDDRRSTLAINSQSKGLGWLL